jgi:stress-induced morphogen
MARKQTKETKDIEDLLKKRFPGFPEDHPPAAYRYNSASIRARLVHRRFEGKSLSARERMVLPVIRLLPEETQMDITILLLLAPDEIGESLGNFEFEHPSPSLL